MYFTVISSWHLGSSPKRNEQLRTIDLKLAGYKDNYMAGRYFMSPNQRKKALFTKSNAYSLHA